jgi:hypothetical protein
LIYTGDVSKRKPGLYFKSPSDKNNTNPNDIVFPTIYSYSSTIEFTMHGKTYTHSTIPNDTVLKTTFKNTSIKNHTIYIIRHGESYHNISMFNLKKDTLLTTTGEKNGKTETKETGTALFQAIRNSMEEYEKVDKTTGNKIIHKFHYFSSDLRRTRETMDIIDKQLQGELLGSLLPKQIIVLSCAHELTYIPPSHHPPQKNKKITMEQNMCDIKNRGKIFPPENRKICSGQCENVDKKKSRENYCCYAGRLLINWTHYNEHNTKDKPRNAYCTTTNFIQEIYEIIGNEISGSD